MPEVDVFQIDVIDLAAPRDIILLHQEQALIVRAAVQVDDGVIVDRALRLDDVGRLTRSVAKIRPFITALDWTPGGLTDAADLKARVTSRTHEQLSLF